MEHQCRNLRQRNVSHEVVRVRKTRCIISRDVIQISEKSCVKFVPKNFLSALYFLNLVLGRPEAQPEGKQQWGDCRHCQQLLRTVCAPERVEGHSWNQTWGWGYVPAGTHWLCVHSCSLRWGDWSWKQRLCWHRVSAEPCSRDTGRNSAFVTLFPQTAQLSW